MTARSDHRDELVATARSLADRGWVANHDGNISVRLRPGRYRITPTATAKARVTGKNILEVDDSGKRVSGQTRPFGELKMHLAIYTRRDDVGAVLHAHPPHATAIACSGQNLIETPFIAEAIVSLGDRIPLLPFTPPGPQAVESLASVARDVDAALLANHGVFSWGKDLEQALLRMELVEHLARIALLAQPIGGVRPLPTDSLPPLLAARARAGLGAAADRAGERKEVIACAPAPHANVAVRGASAGNRAGSDLERLIREEITRALKG